MALLEYRILANYSAGAGWNWEVTAQDRNMIATGMAVTHAQARIDMLGAVASTPVRYVPLQIVCGTPSRVHTRGAPPYLDIGNNALSLRAEEPSGASGL